jgi:glycosylphosphatidylinositol deacylase
MRRRPSASSTTEEEDEHHQPQSASPDVTQRRQEEEDTEESLRKLAQMSTRKYLDTTKEHRRTTRPETQTAWKQTTPPRKTTAKEKDILELEFSVKDIAQDTAMDNPSRRRARWRNPWACSLLTVASLVAAAALILCIWQSFTTRQLDPKGAAMSYMASAFVRFPDFDTEHTRFATKYSLHLYREMGIDDDDPRVRHNDRT